MQQHWEQLAVKIKKNYRTEKSANCEAKNTRGNKKSFVVVDNSSPFPTKDPQTLFAELFFIYINRCHTTVNC